VPFSCEVDSVTMPIADRDGSKNILPHPRDKSGNGCIAAGV
jgi:hypothetical protein